MKALIVQGKEVIVDDDTYQWAKHFKWHLGNEGHVYTRQSKAYIWLHRVIMDTPNGMMCDHIDRNPLNNQRDNLRNCTASQNTMNRFNKPGAVNYRGVSRDNRRAARPYRAYIQKEGKRQSLGVYATAEEAAMAYDKAARELHGEFAMLNFPNIPGPFLKGMV